MYASPNRHYHNLQHIVACLDEFDSVASSCADPLAVELAIWFHDCVYDPTRHDNEERSAEVAREMMTSASVASSMIEKVVSLILATRHTSPPDGPDAQILVDIDLSILGKAPAEFDAYERAIREEYGHVPDAAFRGGRAAILRGFLERPRIYHTPIFEARYGSQARSNLARSIATLGA